MFGRNSASVASFGAMEPGIDNSTHPQQTDKPQEILILGSEGAGKTLLTRRLQESNLEYSEATTEGTIPTVGSDIINLKVNGKSVILREVGSAMASRWDKYLPECDCLMYVIDISDGGSLASSWILFNELLSNPMIFSGKSVVLVLNKTDIADCVVRSLAFNILRIEDLLLTYSPTVSFQIFSGSCLNLKLAETILKWIAASLLSE